MAGDLMNRKIRENETLQRTGWIVASASLLVLSAGLELFVRLTLGHSSVASVILGLFLAFWSYVLGLGLLLFLSVGWLVRLWRARVTQSARNRYSFAEAKSRRLEKPALPDPQYRHQGTSLIVPSRSSREAAVTSRPSTDFYGLQTGSSKGRSEGEQSPTGFPTMNVRRRFRSPCVRSS